MPFADYVFNPADGAGTAFYRRSPEAGGENATPNQSFCEKQRFWYFARV